MDTADRAGIMFVGKRDTPALRSRIIAEHTAWVSRFLTWQSLFGTAELPA